MNKLGTLFVVATPIGNLEDITLRAIRVLREVDIIACEDTRHTGQLLKHLNIKKPLVSYFQHSKLSKVEAIIDELLSGKDIALVTDAGTPAISDPGVALIAEIRNSNIEIRNKENKPHPSSPSKEEGFEEIKVIPIPGPSALTAAASVSGLIEKEFYFAGFLPKKKGRQTFFKNASLFHCPIVIYESALRLERTLTDIQEYLGSNAEVFIAREMTKMFEEYWGGKVSQVLSDLKNHQMKGEIALIIKRD